MSASLSVGTGESDDSQPSPTIHDNGLQRQSHNAPFPHPLSNTLDEDEYESLRHADMPRAVVELRMCDLSYQIRQKPEWWRKINDKTIMEKWRKEILDTEEQLSLGHHKLTPPMVDYVLSELYGYAQLRDNDTGIEMGSYERIWQSDALISSELSGQLQHLVQQLEDVPEAEKDWHPKSDNQVLDLVHPSLYPAVYGRTLHFDTTSESPQLIPLEVPEAVPSVDAALSKRFQWLPSDFQIDENGRAQLVSPYINNLDRLKYEGSYAVIERLVERAVHLWDRVLSDFDRPLTPFRLIAHAPSDTWGPATFDLGCIWGGSGIPYPDSDQGVDMSNEGAADAFYDRVEKTLPKPLPAYVHDDALGKIKKTYTLAGRTIQVIVKLANIHLTPEKPKYAGGSWHVEAMLNECIVSTFIYYFDVKNIKDSTDGLSSRLSFRAAVREPYYHEQDDELCMQTIFGMGRDSPTVQTRGSIRSVEGRCVAFPNVYQHQVQPFELDDPTKPGHRKIVAFFLVDPTQRIPSATHVPNQRREPQPQDAELPGRIAKLPIELRDMIQKNVDRGMTKEEAFQYRLELMEERVGFKEQDAERGYFGHTFNMCEH